MSPKRRVTLRGQWLGQQLRDLRSENALTLEEAAEYLQRNPATVARFETAEYPIRRPDLMALLDLYSVSDTGHRNALLTLSQEVWKKGWWDGYADEVADWFVDYVWLESRAERIRMFEVTPIPGLLQTREYAEAVIRATDPGATEEQVERWVELRLTRQHILDRDDSPVPFAVILDEGVLRRVVGGPRVMRAQLEHVAACIQRPNIQVGIIPFKSGEHGNPAGAFSILSMSDPFPEVGHVETPAGALYVETPDTDRLVGLYDRLWDASLGPTESANLISAIAEELR